MTNDIPISPASGQPATDDISTGRSDLFVIQSVATPRHRLRVNRGDKCVLFTIDYQEAQVWRGSVFLADDAQVAELIQFLAHGLPADPIYPADTAHDDYIAACQLHAAEATDGQ